jgi:hypothetical protein
MEYTFKNRKYYKGQFLPNFSLAILEKAIILS